MTFCVEVECERDGAPDYEEVLTRVATAVLEAEGCPYEAQVELLITDDEGIREINLEQRGIDAPTDVLSFPVLALDEPADFGKIVSDEDVYADCFDPGSGELMLGDIVISIDRAVRQAESYGHTIYREIAFLIAHSMLHLIGYDHMTETDEPVMFKKQDEILEKLGITRELI